MSFKLEIEMGNDAMQTAADVGGALRRIAEDLFEGKTEGRVSDHNGNTVGRFTLERPSTPDDIDWMSGIHDGYGTREEDGGLRIYRTSGECIGWASDINEAIRMMEDDC